MGCLELRQIPWDVSSQTIAVKRGRYTAHGIIPVSFYLTGLIEGTAIVALCRGQNPHGPINSFGQGLLLLNPIKRFCISHTIKFLNISGYQGEE